MLRVSIIVAPAVTVTVSSSVPTFRLMLTTGLAPTCSTMPGLLEGVEALQLRVELVRADRQVGQDVFPAASR